MGAGGTIVFPDSRRLMDPAHWLERLHACGVTVWNTTPQMMVMLCAMEPLSPSTSILCTLGS